MNVVSCCANVKRFLRWLWVKVTKFETKKEYKWQVKADVFSLFFFCLLFYMSHMFIFYVQTLACKTLKANMSWKERNKTSKCGFLNSQDSPQLLMTLEPIYPQNPGSLCFHPVRAPYLWTVTDHSVHLLFHFSLLKSSNSSHNSQRARLLPFLWLQ